MREAVGTLTPLDASALPGSLPARAVPEASPIVVAWRRLARNPLALFGSFVALAYILLGLIGPSFAPYDYAKQNLLQANLPPLSEGHLLGTDQVGRDLFSRLVTGVRISLIVGFGVTAISMIVGTAAGAIAGYRRGWTDSVISGIVDFTWGFPLILLAVIFAGSLGPGLPATILAVGLINWAGFARVVRGEVVVLREEEFVQAARASGLDEPRILLPGAGDGLLLRGAGDHRRGGTLLHRYGRATSAAESRRDDCRRAELHAAEPLGDYGPRSRDRGRRPRSEPAR
jgi:ABC-type amino acid transport system permease subunit